MDFSYFYKESVSSYRCIPKLGSWDYFYSAFNLSHRVEKVFKNIDAKNKYWLVHPEYNIDKVNLPKDNEYFTFEESETEQQRVYNLFNNTTFPNIKKLKNKKICFDITGMMRHEIIYLVKFLKDNSIKLFDIIYSEPSHYNNSEDTKFTKKTGSVRSVDHFFELPTDDHEKLGGDDLLIFGAGFDHEAISRVASYYRSIKNKVHVIGFPSLSADMYQQNIQRANMAEGSIAEGKNNVYFAPASDPFLTANVLTKILSEYSDAANIFLSPLSTKAQTLGFALFFIYELSGKDFGAGIILPDTIRYSDSTSEGISKIWKYTIELPL